jgi:hypothetical protein
LIAGEFIAFSQSLSVSLSLCSVVPHWGIGSMADFNWDGLNFSRRSRATEGGRDSSTGDFLMLREISQQQRRFKRFI